MNREKARTSSAIRLIGKRFAGEIAILKENFIFNNIIKGNKTLPIMQGKYCNKPGRQKVFLKGVSSIPCEKRRKGEFSPPITESSSQ